MADSAATAATTTTTTPLLESTTLRRWNSIATSVMVPNKLALPATPLPHRTTSLQAPLNLDLVSPFSSYTSLKDVLPSTNAAINSPTASAAALISSGYEISIRNRLVKQAAWAYLQPMSSSPSSPSGPDFLRRLWQRFSSGNPVIACLRFIYHHLLPGFAQVLHRILHAIRGQVST